ncbi:MAG TPA: SusC/RagA family TonB-linked outer membrane protein, partial [Chitinophagaceae bacterium]|nr:SusC/RagA family TonB-linked outer membrane protein [Chitinophagaceae bacterium]
MKKMSAFLLIGRCLPMAWLLLLPGFYGHAQETATGLLAGKITGDKGSPLHGATIKINGSSKNIASDADGRFSIPLAPGNYLVEFSFVSYESQRFPSVVITPGKTTSLDVSLHIATGDLDQVVVTALGITRKQKALGYAAQQISGSSIMEAPTANWLNTLAGKVPGMNIQSVDGPTGSANIVVRGNKSFDLGNNGALIVIDGIIISNTPSGNNGGANLASESPVDFGSAVSDLNPDDIADITVLKGPGATALYGARGAGGAIIITTKSGSNHKGLGITLNSAVAFEGINRWPDYQYEYGQGGSSGASYYSYQTTVDGVNTGGTSQAWGPKFNKDVLYFQYDPVTRTTGSQRTPWVAYPNNRKDLFRTGITYNNSISIDGGNQNTSVRLSINNYNNKWILPNTGYNRTSVNFSLQHKVNEKLKINAKINYTYKQSDNLPNLGYDNKTLAYFLIAHSPNIDVNWYKNYWITKDITQSRPFGTSVVENPYFALYEQLNPVQRNGALGNVGFTYNILPHLVLSAKTGIDFYQDVSSSRQPKSSQRFPNGMYKEQNILRYEINSDFLLSYNRSLSDDFKLGVSVGGNRMSSFYNRTRAMVNQLVIPGVYKLNNGVERPVFDGYKEARAINSLYGFANLSYKDYLFLDITGRNDWSSTLPANNNSYFYPSVNLSAIITDMFSIHSDWLSFAKLRLSYADVGNDNRSLLPIGKYYSPSTFSSSLVNPGTRSNYDLKPERTRSYEVGTELRFFKNRVGADVSAYQNDTYNQILPVPVDGSSGYGAAALNAGLVRNLGMEVQAWWQAIQRKRFQWKITGNWSRNQGTILRLADDVESFQIASGPGGVALLGKVGGEIGDIYGRGYTRAPDGQIVYANGLPIISTDVTKRGNANPTFRAG